MNKRITKLLSVFVLAGVIGAGAAFTATGCKPKPQDPPADQTQTTPTVTSVTASADKTTAKVGEKVNLSATVTGENSPAQTVTWAITEGSDKATLNGSVLTLTGAGTVKVQATSTVDTTKKSDEVTITVEAAEPETLEVTYELTVDQKLATGKTADARTVSIFTLGANTEVRGRTKGGVYENKEGGAKVSDASYTKSIKMGGSADAFIIDAPEKGTFTMHVQNGSSGTKDWQKLYITKLGETPEQDGTPVEIKYAAFDGSPLREVVIEIAEKGKYKISRTSGTSDIFYAKYVAVVKNTPMEDIELTSNGTTSYFVGQEYTTAGIGLNKVFAETHRTEPLELTDTGVTIDSSAVNKNQSGVYQVKVKYNDGKKDYEKTIAVTYYAVESLELGKNAIKTAKNSYNGIYVNSHLRELYVVGEQFSTEGLTVHVIASLETDKGKVTKDFRIADGYTLSGNGTDVMSEAGKHTVTVTLDGTSVNATFDIFVVAAPESLKTAEKLDITVDAAVADAAVGTVGANGYQFQTIHQALSFIENCGIPDSALKTINLAAGTYKEKLEINVPNISIVGAGTGKTGYSMIEWDSLYGIEDESGFVHTTDSTSTLNVREKATGFSIKNVIVSNWFNSLAHFDEKMGVGYSEHRALALLVQADKVVIDSCSLLGYQDTVEFFTGRQVVKNSYICGYTDFIFGTNNTTYFTGCTIESIAGKDAATHGGYVTAFKGNNGSNTKVTYGAIFDNCDFIAETGSAEGKTALGRPWGADAAVMVMNSSLGAHISKTVYNGESRDVRYVAMTNEPQNAQFKEYNNRGVGAITESQTITKKDPTSGEDVVKNIVEVLQDATAADKYKDFAVIFGTTNGQVTYLDAWDGTAGAKITSESWTLVDEITAQVQVTADPIDILDGKVTLKSGKINPNANSGCCIATVGTVIEMKETGKVSLAWYNGGTDQYGNNDNAKIVYKDGKATITIVATSGASTQVYLRQIIIDHSETPEDTPEASTYQVTFDLNGAEGTAPAALTVEQGEKAGAPFVPVRSGYKFLGWYTAATEGTKYDFNAQVTAPVDLYAHWEQVTTPVVIEENVAITFGTSGNYQEYLASTAITGTTVNSTTYRNNGGNNSQLSDTFSIRVKVGATVSVSSYSGYTNYTVSVNGGTASAAITDTSNEITVSANDTDKEYATITFACGGNNYFYSISVSYGLTQITEAKTFVSTEGIVSNSFIEFSEVQSHNGGEYWNLGKTGSIKINVAAGAKIKLSCGYWGAGIAINGVAQDTSAAAVEYTATEGGEVVIGCITEPANVAYLQKIEVTFA